MKIAGISKIYETTPVEVEEAQPEYLNCVVALECGVPAVELLRFCQGVEAALGRERKGERAPRTIDIDLLLFGEEVVEESGLLVPPPGILRAFNLRGLADLGSDIEVPGYGTVGALLEGVDMEGVRELEGTRLC